MGEARILVLVRSILFMACLLAVQPAGAEEMCRKYVPSAGITIEVPCNEYSSDAPAALKPKTPAAPKSADKPVEAKPVVVSPAPANPAVNAGPSAAAAADVTAMERWEGHELQGNAYRVIQLPDAGACERACLDDAKCVASEYYRQKRGCGLFSVLPPMKRAKLIDSALKKGPGPVKVAPVAVQAAGLPVWCGTQQTFNDAEKLVCGDRELSALDVELQQVFDTSLKILAGGKTERDKLQAAEDAWSVTRDACKSNRVCVKAAYELRIEQLRQEYSVARQ